MPEQIQKQRSLTKLFLGMFRRYKILKIFILATLILICAHAYSTVLLTKNLSRLFFNLNIQSSDILLSQMKNLVYFFFLEYFLEELVKYLKYHISILLYIIFINEGLQEILHEDYTTFHKIGSGKNQNNLLNSSWGCYGFGMLALVEIPQCCIIFIILTLQFFEYFKPAIFCFFLFMMSLCVIFSIIVTKTIFKHDVIISNFYAKCAGVLSDILINYDIVKAFNKEYYEKQQYKNTLNDYEIICRRASFIKNGLGFLQKFFFFIPYYIILNMFIFNYTDTGITAENIFNYNELFIRYRNNFILLRGFIFSISSTISEMKLRFTIREYENEIGLTDVNFENNIKLHNVSLYADDSLIQKNVCLEFFKGDKVAITGLNGCGKSTFLKTIIRFFKHTGTFTIDGVPIDLMSEKALRNLIAYVPQNPFIFNNTVLYNLGYSRENIEREEIYRICQKHGLHEFFKNLKDGYDTIAGENGINLSGGQKQRISFMRAIIKDAPIIILDEPTASMDKKSEKMIVEDLLSHSEDKTIFIIVHNLELMKKFNKILYFNREGVEMFNSYEEFKAENQQLNA